MLANVLRPEIAKTRQQMLLEMANYSADRIQEPDRSGSKNRYLGRAIALVFACVLIVIRLV